MPKASTRRGEGGGGLGKFWWGGEGFLLARGEERRGGSMDCKGKYIPIVASVCTYIHGFVHTLLEDSCKFIWYNIAWRIL